MGSEMCIRDRLSDKARAGHRHQQADCACIAVYGCTGEQWQKQLDGGQEHRENHHGNEQPPVVLGGLSDDSEHAVDSNAGVRQPPLKARELEQFVCLADEDVHIIDHLFRNRAVGFRA